MRKHIFKACALMLATVLSITLMCFSASAAEAEVTWTLNNTHYSTGSLKDGLTAMMGNDEGIMMINSDFTAFQKMEFPKGSCVIDLDGHTITFESAGLTVGEEATVRIVDGKGTGSIVLKSSENNSYAFEVLGTLIFQSGIIKTQNPDTVGIRSTGTLIIGGGAEESNAEAGNVQVDGGKLQLIGKKGLIHKLSRLKIASDVDVMLNCAVTMETFDATDDIKAGYEGVTELLIVDKSEKSTIKAADIGTYKGHTKSAAEIMGLDDTSDNQALYIVITVAATVLLVALAAILTVIIIKKGKKKAA